LLGWRAATELRGGGRADERHDLLVGVVLTASRFVERIAGGRDVTGGLLDGDAGVRERDERVALLAVALIQSLPLVCRQGLFSRHGPTFLSVHY